jgi:hypothetical protein
MVYKYYPNQMEVTKFSTQCDPSKVLSFFYGTKTNMENLTQNMLLFLIVILIALCSFYIFQWNKEKNQSNHLNNVMEQIVFRNFTNFT